MAKGQGVDLGDGWGKFEYPDNVGRPATEKVFFDLLSYNAESTNHWFHQLGFMRECVRTDLQWLSHERPGTRKGIKLLDFKREHPVIFSVLAAAFKLFPSNSRLAESSHGMLQDSLKSGTSLMFTDARQAYLIRDEYRNREERRKFARS